MSLLAIQLLESEKTSHIKTSHILDLPKNKILNSSLLDSLSTSKSSTSEIIDLSLSTACGCSYCSGKEAKTSHFLERPKGVNAKPPWAGGGDDGSSDKLDGTIADMAAYLTNGYWEEVGYSGRLGYNITDSGYNPNSGVLYYYYGNSTLDGNGILGARKTLVDYAFQYYQNLLGIEFINVADVSGGLNVDASSNDYIDFWFIDNQSGAYWTFGGDSYYEAIDYSIINVDDGWYGGSSDPWRYTHQTYLHEIGHAMGLGHQGNYNGTGGFDGDATYLQDSWQASMMSYFSQDENPNTDASFAFLSTSMTVDNYALDQLYASQSYDAKVFGTSQAFLGDTVYGNNTNIDESVSYFWNNWLQDGVANAFTIADGGGTDTIDVSVFGVDQLIDLTVVSATGTNLYASNIAGLIGNLTLSVGTVIENAIGGSGSDVFYGNGFNNSLVGNGGNDIFYYSLGSDSVDGGTGDDTIIFSGNLSDYTVSVQTSSLKFSFNDSELMASAVEWFEFSDGTYSAEQVVSDGSGDPTDPPPVSETTTLAPSSQSIVYGSLSGAIGNLQEGNDGLVQSLRESSTKGNPRNRYDRLEVIYNFDTITEQVINSVTLKVDEITGESADDQLAIAFSSDGGNEWLGESLLVGLQEYSFDSVDSLLVKIYDTSRVPGDSTNISVVIDQLFATADLS